METGQESTTTAQPSGESTPAGDIGTARKTTRLDRRSRGAEFPGYIVLLKAGRLFGQIRSAEDPGKIGDSRSAPSPERLPGAGEDVRNREEKARDILKAAAG